MKFGKIPLAKQVEIEIKKFSKEKYLEFGPIKK